MTTASLKDDVKGKGRDISCDSATPIVVAMDVTSSRGDDSKILYDKLPMFFGQVRHSRVAATRRCSIDHQGGNEQGSQYGVKYRVGVQKIDSG